MCCDRHRASGGCCVCLTAARRPRLAVTERTRYWHTCIVLPRQCRWHPRERLHPDCAVLLPMQIETSRADFGHGHGLWLADYAKRRSSRPPWSSMANEIFNPLQDKHLVVAVMSGLGDVIRARSAQGRKKDNETQQLRFACSTRALGSAFG
jgi:hypothetical protein